MELSANLRYVIESDKEPKLSKNQRRKARRYGKKPMSLPNSGNHKNNNTNFEFRQFVKSLVQPRSEEDHSLDELHIESGRRPWPLLPGSYEMGKRR